MLSPQDMLDLIAQPFYRAVTKRGRVALLDIYATTLTALGIAWVQTNYATVLRHLIDDLPKHSRSTASRAEVLTLRSGVNLILRRVIGERMLGEQAQVTAAQEICNSYLKRYPVVMPGQPPPPSKYTLVLALGEVAGLLHQLGNAPPQILDTLYDPLLRCMAHPSHSVQISAAWCLRTLCHIYPVQLAKTIPALVELLNKDLKTLNGAGERGGAEVSKRAIGHARGLAAVLSVIPSRPLYTSFDVGSQVMDMASSLLKSCGDHSWSIASVEIQVAWTLLSALMSLGPNFVRPHMDHLTLLWRNALPKPDNLNGGSSSSSAPSSRSEAEWALMLHLRESALGCILAFLSHNDTPLLSLDTARRLVALLSNTLAFVDNFASQHPGLAQEQIPGAERSQLTLLDREHLLRRRLFQCFAALATNAAMEPLQDSLISVSLHTFAEPDRYVGSAAQAAIAASAGSFTTLWAMSDSYAFGVTSLQRDDETFIATSETDPETQSAMERRRKAYPATEETTRPNLLNRDSVEVQLDALSRRPVLGAAEHDPLVLFSRYDLPTGSAPLPPPPATAMVDSALALFAALLPFQKRHLQISAFETLLTYSRSAKLEKNPGRRAAIQINACVASLGALRVAMSGSLGIGGVKPTGFNNDRLTTALREVLKDALLYGDSVLRSVSSQTYGRLAAVAGSQAMSSQVQFLVDQVVSNRDPDARAGCALAFGAIYSEVGGLSAGPLTKTVVNVLMSLSSDPHPTVHYAALQALRLVIDAASLSYAPYVSGTLGMLVKLSMQDTHEPEGGSAGSVNLRADLPAHQMICRVVSGLVGVLGPDLQESSKVRGLIHALLDEMSKEKDDDGVVVEAAKARQHYCLFVAAEQMDLPAWVAQLTENLRNRKRPRKLAAVHGLYQLVQRQALLVSKLGGDGLVADLFAQLDIEPSMDGVREVLLSWLRQTAELSPGSWIDLCQRIIIGGVHKGGNSAAPKAGAEKHRGGPQLQDEEAAGLGVEDEASSTVAALQGSRWRTRLFALQCLHEVFVVVRRSGHLEHFATPPSQHNADGERKAPSPAGAPPQRLMSSRVADLIRMAFTASTSANDEIRLAGLVVLQDVIESFKLARDPEFEEALLLEQHQAPIAAALTPAFLADSTPEVLAAAIGVCAVFVGSGVVRDVTRMGRILKQLVTVLQSCSNNGEMRSLGDVKDLSPNAAGMLKIATFSAWSDLAVAAYAGSQPYLLPVVEPHLNGELVPYWVASLREYAKIKIDPDSSSAGLGLGMGGDGFVVVNPSLDSQWAGLAREVLLPYYQQSWAKMLRALSVLMDKDNAAVFKALDGGEDAGASAFRSEPTLSFFVLYGLAFEALASSAGAAMAGSATLSSSRTQETTLIYLAAMRSLARPQVAGTAIIQDSTFGELVNLCFRLTMTESAAVQGAVLDLVVGLAKAYDQRLFDGSEEPATNGDKGSSTGSTLSSAAKKLTSLLRIIVCAISRAPLQPGASTEEKALLLRSGFSALLTLAEMLPLNAGREDVYCTAWHLYAELLSDERLAGGEAVVDIVPLTLASLRDLCQRSASLSTPGVGRSTHGLVSLALNSIDDLRGRAGKVATAKTRNCLMALTVVLTSIAGGIVLSKPVLEQACYLVVHKMSTPFLEEQDQQDEDDQAISAAAAEVPLTAANCGRSILVAGATAALTLCGEKADAAPSSTCSLAYCVGQLLPGFVHLATLRAATSVQRAIALEILRSFAGMFPSTSNDAPQAQDLRARLMGIVLPAYLCQLRDEDADDGSEEGRDDKEIAATSVAHLLDLASRQPSAFREATARLPADARGKLEKAIRGAIAARQQRGGSGGGQTGGNAARRGDKTEGGEGGAGIALKSFA